jgi:hypothetical protein
LKIQPRRSQIPRAPLNSPKIQAAVRLIINCIEGLQLCCSLAGKVTSTMLAKSQFHLPRPQCTKIPPLPHPTVDWRLVHTPVTTYESITCTKTPSNSIASLSIQSFRHLDIHDKMPQIFRMVGSIPERCAISRLEQYSFLL